MSQLTMSFRRMLFRVVLPWATLGTSVKVKTANIYHLSPISRRLCRVRGSLYRRCLAETRRVHRSSVKGDARDGDDDDDDRDGRL